MYIQDEGYQQDFEKAESADSFLAFEDYEQSTKTRSIRLYAILATYLKNRPLRILRSVKNGDGFRVWRTLTDELQPKKSRPRALALAQALVKFPPFKDGGSLLDYTLAFERLVGEYDKVSPHPYDDNLKISTLMSGLPSDVKKYLQLTLDDKVTYERLRNRLLQYERTTAMWSSEHLLRSVGIDKDSGKFLDAGQTAPMDVDRVEGRKGKDGDGKGKGGKSKGKWGKDKGGKGKQKDGYGKFGGVPHHNGKGWGNWGGQIGWNDRQKGKEQGGKGKAKGKDKGKKQVGPCFSCGRMGHVAADCRSRANQVVDDSSSQSLSSAASTSSSNTRVPSLPSTQPTNIRRLQVWHEQEQEVEPTEINIYTPPDTPVCTFFDLSSQDYEDGELEQFFEVRVATWEDDAELKSTSTLLFDLAAEDSEVESVCHGHVRAVSEIHTHEYEQVILDSGADVTVVPMTHGDVGHASVNNQSLSDAQGNNIPMAGMRQDVVFEVLGTNGQRLFFKDKVIVARVKQPLVCMGKLMRDNWMPEQVNGEWTLRKGDQSFPVYWSRNSLAANMRIFRLEERATRDDLCVRVVVEISEQLEEATGEQGWSMSPDQVPMHVSLESDCTADPSLQFPSQYWPFRTTLISRGERKYEVFESGEYWADRRFIETGEPKTKVVTLLSLEPVDPESLGKAVVPYSFQLSEPAKPMEVEPETVDGTQPGGQEESRPLPSEEQRPIVVQGPASLVVNGVEITEESTLKLLRNACKFLRISHHGSKAVLWGRLQSEIADNQLKASVQASDAVLEAYKREPDVERVHEPPDAETVALHEVTHCPRMPWCSACTAMRSREDNHVPSAPKEGGVIHLDLMFTKTEIPGEAEDPLACHMVMVDEQTNFVSCVPVESKATDHLRVAVDELVKMATLLGHTNLTIRGDSEPAIKSFLQVVSSSRTRMGVATKVELAPPDSKLHHGLKAERFIGIVRDLGNTLLATIKERTGFTVRSGHPVFQWAFRHSAFLYTRFHVQQSGQTAFELVHGRSYAGKLCPYGSAVFAQLLPLTPAKGNGWTKGIFLGKSTLGNLKHHWDQHRSTLCSDYA